MLDLLHVAVDDDRAGRDDGPGQLGRPGPAPEAEDEEGDASERDAGMAVDGLAGLGLNIVVHDAAPRAQADLAVLALIGVAGRNRTQDAVEHLLLGAELADGALVEDEDVVDGRQARSGGGR